MEVWFEEENSKNFEKNSDFLFDRFEVS